MASSPWMIWAAVRARTARTCAKKTGNQKTNPVPTIIMMPQNTAQ